ncbi:glycosyltransferase family 4 protein [Sphingomonas sp. 28-63-12]|uniref:glycosyltransferase family 4 protein n=1 Tax=Sphingomonas sp. 28-63-12 TaxID=1970434 RepID=UPI000BC5871F|nr:MAG: hypothetical protein B7Y47_15155 [Sphingomonas sp. 28-63-12]
MKDHGRRIIFVNRFYHPDHSATAQILTDLAEALAAAGWAVTVVTSRLCYDDPSVRLADHDECGGVAIHRVPTTSLGQMGVAGRLVDYCSFYVAALVALLRHARRGDIIVAKTDPPLMSVIAALVARVRGARLVNWLQDLYPEVAGELGVAAMRGPAGRALRLLRNASLRSAAINVVIGERMAERLVAEGIAANAIAVLPNWADDEVIRPVARAEVSLRRIWGLDHQFVVGYSGNLGRAHDSDTIVKAALLLRERSDIVFLMIGGGHESAKLATRVQAAGLGDRFQFQPYQPRDLLVQSLAVADVHWLSLYPALEGLIVPSKFYGIAAAGRPVIAITDPDGEIARIVDREGCGIVVAPGEGAKLARAIEALAGDPPRLAAMGRAGRALIDRDNGRSASLARWSALLDSLPT